MSSGTEIRRPTRKEIDLFYKTNRSRFRSPERVHILQIVKHINEMTARDEATRIMEEALAALQGGTSFAEVANRYSDCPGNGGDLGWVTPGVMVEEFENVVFSLGQNEITSVFETQFGLHIAQLIDRRPEGILPLREVYDQLADWLYQQRLRDVSKQAP